MKTIDQVRRQLFSGDYVVTRHAFRRLVERNISEREIREAGRRANVIEEYPDDKYSPSCLLLGFTRMGRPLHIQVSLADGESLRIITLYEPSQEEWVNYSRRR
ncbi:MAG: DUF4258 domain-containing protein [Deltaproteobacteria bacterium]|nr:DUF4258 domain-containing protein [Deltaproteobacteria bacterium]